jgi:hypothetical protein
VQWTNIASLPKIAALATPKVLTRSLSLLSSDWRLSCGENTE